MSIKGGLKKFIKDAAPTLRGSVVRVTANSIFVSSSVGLKEFQVDSPGSFRSGDSVKFQGNTYLGKLPPEPVQRTYVV